MYPIRPDDGEFRTQQIFQLYAHAGTLRRDDADIRCLDDPQMDIAPCRHSGDCRRHSFCPTQVQGTGGLGDIARYGGHRNPSSGT